MKSFTHSLEKGNKRLEIQFDYIHTPAEGKYLVTVPHEGGKIMFNMQLDERGTWRLMDKYKVIPPEWHQLAPLLSDLILGQNKTKT